MKTKPLGSIAPALIILMIAALACTLGKAPPVPASQATATAPEPVLVPVQASLTAAVVEDVPPTIVPFTPTSPVAHKMKPAAATPLGKLVYDVESQGTASEKRAPYGDSYDINRLERPFLQDMTYVANLDLSTYNVGQDADWYYVSITLVGNEPNDKLGIHYGVELDLNHDGFGDYLLVAHPPYPIDWDTAPVQIFKDTNHDTGGLSAEKSDAPLKGDGYDTRIFDGGAADADPDVAWVRVNHTLQGSVEFAFKRSWSGSVFMLGVLADAGLKDPSQLDYVDRMKLEDAGSPVRDNKYYPLKGLFAVDNVCREAFGFKPTGYEPQLCPHDEPAPKRPPKPGVTPSACQDPGYCTYGWDPVYCMCIIG